jgi:hypothetical protein
MGAAIAVPLIVAAIPMLSPLITGLVHHGKLPGQLAPASIAMMVESEVQQLKATGALSPETSAAIIAGTPAPKAGPFTLTGTLTFKPE